MFKYFVFILKLNIIILLEIMVFLVNLFYLKEKVKEVSER